MEKLSESPTIAEDTSKNLNKLLTTIFFVGFVFYIIVSTAIFRSQPSLPMRKSLKSKLHP